MSEGRLTGFWKRNKLTIHAGLIAALMGVSLAIPFVQSSWCPISKEHGDSGTYRVTVHRQQSEPDSKYYGDPGIAHFTFGPTINGNINEVETTESSYQSPQQEKNWGRRFWCDIKASDYFLIVFTLWLALSTFLLWRETDKLAQGAADQAEKMRQSIREQRRSNFAAFVSAKATRKAANAAERSADAAFAALARPSVVVDLPILNRRIWLRGESPLEAMFRLRNYGKAPAVIHEIRGTLFIAPRRDRGTKDFWFDIKRWGRLNSPRQETSRNSE